MVPCGVHFQEYQRALSEDFGRSFGMRRDRMSESAADQLAQTAPDATDWNKRGCLYRLNLAGSPERTCSFGQETCNIAGIDEKQQERES